MADSQGPLHGVRVVETATLVVGQIVEAARILAATVLDKSSLGEGGS